MSYTIHWQQIALRLVLASVGSLLIGLNRDERGRSAGVRTTMLVCLAATFATLQMNLLLTTSGKSPSSFSVMDIMRLPLGILSGIGFIGAGVILKGRRTAKGVTTAATMWYVTVLGLLFGTGEVILGCTGTVLGLLILSVLKHAERWIPRSYRATLCLTLNAEAPSEVTLRQTIEHAGCRILRWKITYKPAGVLSALECTLGWREHAFRSPHTPQAVTALRSLPGILSVVWQE